MASVATVPGYQSEAAALSSHPLSLAIAGALCSCSKRLLFNSFQVPPMTMYSRAWGLRANQGVLFLHMGRLSLRGLSSC